MESLLDYLDAAFKGKSKYEQAIHSIEVARVQETYFERR